MDHVERLLEVRELRAIVCVCVVDSRATGEARLPGGGVIAILLSSSLCGGVDFAEAPGIVKEKQGRRGVAVVLRGWVRNGEEESSPAERGRYMASGCWSLRSEHLCDFEIAARCGLARPQIKAPRWFFLDRTTISLNFTHGPCSGTGHV